MAYKIPKLQNFMISIKKSLKINICHDYRVETSSAFAYITAGEYCGASVIAFGHSFKNETC